MGISNALKAATKATEDVLQRFLPAWLPGRTEIAAGAGYVEYAGSPVGNLTPDFIGQRCQDTTTGLFYVAQTVSANGWALSTAGLSLSTTNSAAAATANVTAIQAALTAGGLVQITAPGTYYINSTLTIYSNSTLYIGAGVTLIVLSGAGGKPVLQNYAFTQRSAGTTVTLTWSAGTSASIAWTAHGLSKGDAVYLQGATLSVFNTIGVVNTVTDANNVVIDLQYVPGGAVSGTIKAIKCDQNITVDVQGVLDYNYPNNDPGASNLSSCGVTLGIIHGLRVRALQVRNAMKFACMYGAVRDFTIDNMFAPVTNSDILHGYGPLINGAARNTAGRGGDDCVILQPRESSAFPNFVWTNGDVINVHIDGADCESVLSGAGIVQLYPNGTDKMIGIKVSRVSGITNGGGGVQVISAQSASDVVESLEIDHVNVKGLYGVRIDRSASNAVTVNHLRVRGLQENSQSTSALCFFLGTACAVRDGEIDVNVNNSAFTGGQYAAQISGTYQRLKFGGSINGGSAARGVQIQTAQTGELIVSMTQRTGDQLVGGTAVSGTITLRDCDTAIANVISPTTVSGTVNVNLVGNRFNNASGGVVRSTSGTFNIRSGGNDWQGTSVPALAPSGTPTFNLYGLDMSVDVGATWFSKTTSGQYCFNNGAARGTLTQNRLVTCNGTNWVQVDDTTKTF